MLIALCLFVCCVCSVDGLYDIRIIRLPDIFPQPKFNVSSTVSSGFAAWPYAPQWSRDITVYTGAAIGFKYNYAWAYAEYLTANSVNFTCMLSGTLGSITIPWPNATWFQSPCPLVIGNNNLQVNSKQGQDTATRHSD